MSNHTPGPWHVDGRDVVTGEPPYQRGRKDWRYIASCVGGFHNKDEMDANVRLIAAAPDMLAALQAIECAIEVHGLKGNRRGEVRSLACFPVSLLEQMRAAIAKAEGRG